MTEDEKWVIKSLTEGAGSDGNGMFWNILYDVPTDFAQDGTYSVSFPKQMVENYAAEYGYDVEDQEDLDALFKHIAYLGVMVELDRREKKDPRIRMPMLRGQASAKKAVHDRIGEIEKRMPVIQQRQVSMKMGVNQFGDVVADVVTEVDVFAVIRADASMTRESVAKKAKLLNRNLGDLRE